MADGGFFGGLSDGITQARQGKAAAAAGAADMQLKLAEFQLKATSANLANQEAQQKIDQGNRTATIQAHMSAAAQAGGLPAVIDYLKVADPNQAIAIQKAKSDFDNSVLAGQATQTATSKQKQEILEASYKAVGNMGSQILNAPPEQRDALYQNMKPILDKMAPGILPDTFTPQAQAILVGVQGLAIPAAIVYTAQQEQAKMQTESGKLSQDYTRVAAQFGQDSPQAKIINSQVRELNAKAVDAEMKASGAMLPKERQEAETKLRDEVSKATEDYRTIESSYNSFKQAEAAQIPADGGATRDLQLLTSYMKMLSPRMSVKAGSLLDIAGAEGTQLGAIMSLYNKTISSPGALLEKSKREEIATLAAKLYDQSNLDYNQRVKGYQKIATDAGLDHTHIFMDGNDEKSKIMQYQEHDPKTLALAQSLLTRPEYRGYSVGMMLKAIEEKRQQVAAHQAATAKDQPKQGGV